MALVQAPSSINDLRPHLSMITDEDFLGLPKRKPKGKLRKNFLEPDYRVIDECLSVVEKTAIVVGEMEDEISDEEGQYIKELSIKLYELVERIDWGIAIVKSLPESVPWKQKAYEKLVHLSNRTEDVAEVCELAVDEEFINMIKDRIQDYLTARSEN